MTSREIAEKTVSKLKDAVGGYPACPFCSNRTWSVGDQITLTGSIDPETNNINPASGVPGVPLVCDNCGYTASINPKAVGAM